MKKNNIITIIITLITIVAFAVFTFTIVHAAVYNPDGSATVLTPPPTTAITTTSTPSSTVSTKNTPSSTEIKIPSNFPSRFEIPSLGINAAVQRVGVTAKGNIGTPNNFTDVAWYSYGIIPGQVGNAIIDGHVDNGLSLPGVFKNLKNISVGGSVYVTTYGGKKLHFIVTDIQTYNYADFPSGEVLDSAAPSPELTLITCTGTWVPDDKTYNERLVVTAVLART